MIGVFAIAKPHDCVVAAIHNYRLRPSLSLGETCQRALEGQPGEKCRSSIYRDLRVVDEISENVALAIVVISFVAAFKS